MDILEFCQAYKKYKKNKESISFYLHVNEFTGNIYTFTLDEEDIDILYEKYKDRWKRELITKTNELNEQYQETFSDNNKE